jgi:hypothetical protein
VDDTQFRALLVVVRDMGNRTGFVQLCLFGDLPVIVLISFELTLLDSLMANEDDRLIDFDFLSRRIANGSVYLLHSGRPCEFADVLQHGRYEGAKR